MTTTNPDIAIVGGGLTGPALALALADAGVQVTLIDAAPPRRRAEAGVDGRAYSLARASVALLEAVGLWPELAPLAQPILRVEAGDGTGQGTPSFFLGFDSSELEGGAMGHMLEDRHLHGAAVARLAAHPRIQTVFGTGVVAQECHGNEARLTLSDGRAVTARLAVGCDGRASPTAERAGIRRVGWPYGQTSVVTAITHADDHHGVARQIFLSGGPLALLPLPGGRQTSVVWSVPDATAQALLATGDAAFIDALSVHAEPVLGAIAGIGPRFGYPLSLSLAERFVAPRLALVGDAAHGVHPIAGQGLNLGLRDVAALAEVLVDAGRRGEDIGAPDVLDRYQRWRRSDATLLALGMDRVNALFSNDNPLLAAARQAGLRAVAGLPALRRAFQREAAGLSGDRPRLLTGRRL
jgi:2-octaprenyl-6-methoxyphenol hydroxylase